MENLTERQIEILKVIERKPGIPHNKLLKIVVEQKKIMAKRTFEKNLKELLKYHVKSHKYKKEKQYFRNEEGLSEKDIDKEIQVLFTRIFDALSELQKNSKNNEYDVKVRLAHYLFRWLEEFSSTKRTVESETDRIKTTDMSEEEEILYEIKKIIKDKEIDWQNSSYKYYSESCEIMDKISKIKNEHLQLITMRKKHGASKKRSEIDTKLNRLVQEWNKSFTLLERNLKELKKSAKSL